MKKKSQKALRRAIEQDRRCRRLHKRLDGIFLPQAFTDFLKKPLAEFGGKTPRQMLGSKKNFAKLIKFIKKNFRTTTS